MAGKAMRFGEILGKAVGGAIVAVCRFIYPPLRTMVDRVSPVALRLYRFCQPVLGPVVDLLSRGAQWAFAKCQKHIAGGDPVFARAFTWSFLVHFLVIFCSVLPIFLEALGCVEDYEPPAGEEMQAEPQKKIRVEVKRWIVNPMSAIRLDLPNPEKVDVELDRNTEHPWTGVVGAGGKAGFRGGYRGGVVRFIRLKHGGDWDNDIDADENMLRMFGQHTRMPVRSKAETLSIRKLLKFKPHKSPPFVYIYGTRVCDIRDNETNILKRYLTERGGMLIADAGGPGFNSSFRRIVSKMFPNNRLMDIPNDDPIYQRPFRLATGAPLLWHHGGRRAMGVRYQNRLVIFYHPGDMNDAWKTGHSDARRDVWEAAYKVGTNVIHYSVNQYIRFLGRQ